MYDNGQGTYYFTDWPRWRRWLTVWYIFCKASKANWLYNIVEYPLHVCYSGATLWRSSGPTQPEEWLQAAAATRCRRLTPSPRQTVASSNTLLHRTAACVWAGSGSHHGAAAWCWCWCPDAGPCCQECGGGCVSVVPVVVRGRGYLAWPAPPSAALAINNMMQPSLTWCQANNSVPFAINVNSHNVDSTIEKYFLRMYFCSILFYLTLFKFKCMKIAEAWEGTLLMNALWPWNTRSPGRSKCKCRVLRRFCWAVGL